MSNISLKPDDIMKLLDYMPKKAPMQSIDPNAQAPLTPQELENASTSGAQLADSMNFPSLENLTTPIASASPSQGLSKFQPNENAIASRDFLSSLMKGSPQIQAKTEDEEVPEEVLPTTSGAAGVSPRGSTQHKPNITEQSAPVTASASLVDTEMEKALKEAKENRSRNSWKSGLFEMMGGLGSLGGSRVSSESKALENAIASENAPLTDINTQREQYKKFLSNAEEKDKNDPNSAVSNTMRTALEEMGVKIPKNATYASMEKLAPQLMANQQMKDRMADRALARESLNSSKQDKVTEKERYHQDAYLQFATSKTAPIRSSYSAIQNAARLSSTGTKNPAEDITALYSFVKNLDPNSSVREGEVGLARDIASIQGKVQTYFNKVSNGDSLDSKTVDNLKKEILRMADSQKQSYNTEMAAYKAGAKNRGVPESRYVEFDPQHSTNDNAKTSEDEKISNDEHQQAIAWAKANPSDSRSSEILKRNGVR